MSEADKWRNEAHRLNLEVERLREGISKHWKVVCDQRAELETLRAELAKSDNMLRIRAEQNEDFGQLIERQHAQVAERDALLRDAHEELVSRDSPVAKRIDAALSASAAPSAPKFGVLAGEPEIIGERCKDGGACHHECTQTCFRRLNCGALTGSGLNPDWSEPSAESPLAAKLKDIAQTNVDRNVDLGERVALLESLIRELVKPDAEAYPSAYYPDRNGPDMDDWVERARVALEGGQ